LVTRSIPWPRILAEGIVIIVSILLALAADSWYQDRSDRLASEEYLERLAADLSADTATFHLMLDVLHRKDANLEAVARVALGSEGPDSAFFESLNATQFLGFNAPGAQRATYDDLIATGGIGLIRDQALRGRIVSYYDYAENQSRRIEERRTEYPHAVYRLDASNWRGLATDSAFERLVDQALDSIRTPGFLNLLNAERTLSAFQRETMASLADSAAALLGEVQPSR
jgi:hypothetical protein